MSGIRGVATILVCCVSLAVSTPAVAAADPAQDRKAFDEGRRRFLAGEYREALAQFKQGFLDTENASFLLNIAQCHRFLGEPAEALMMYRLYLKSAQAGGNPEAQAVATKAIRELEGETDARTAAAKPVVTSPPPEGQSAAVPVAAPATSIPPPPGGNRQQNDFAYPVLDSPQGLDVKRLPATPPNPPANPSTTHSLRLAGVVCASAGLASMGAGVYYWTRATALSDSANKATAYNQADYDQGKRAETLQWVFYGVGAVAVVTGATLFVYGNWSPSAKKTIVSLAPVVGPGAAGLLAHGAF